MKPFSIVADQAPTAADREGRVLAERYDLLREIARGGACAIFQARHRSTQRVVAAKVLVPEKRRDKVQAARLLREAQALTVARHPGVVDVLDGGECPQEGPFLILEMLDGRPLDGLLTTRGKLPVEEVVRVAVQLLIALDHMHFREVVHRDIKPSNVFVSRDVTGRETVKLLDLGVAGVGKGWDERKLTMTDELVGTPEYMAPEQLMAQPDVDHRADIFAAAVTLFECLAGEVPYSGTYPQVLVQVTQGAPRRKLYELRPEVGRRLSAVIEGALAVDRKTRPQRARDFAHDILDAASVGPGATSLLSGQLPGARRPNGDSLQPRPASAKEALRQFTSGVVERPEAQLDPRARRSHKRAPYVTQVRLVFADGVTLDGRSEDVSEGGLLVLTEWACPSEQEAELRFGLPLDGKIARVKVRTKWVKAARDLHATGLQFLDLGDRERAAIKRYIELMGDESA